MERGFEVIADREEDFRFAPLWRRPAEEPRVAEGSGKPEPRRKASYVGAPAVFKLEQACQQLRDAFGGFGCYLVGSATQRADWRDVDVRLILRDEEFADLFPGTTVNGAEFWEHDPRWLVMTVSISGWLKEQTGLPVDFQFQPQSHANHRHSGSRHALGLRIARE